MSHAKPATTYPDSVFKQTTPDETQDTKDTVRLTTIVKDVRTRAEIYTRVFPDQTTAALCIDGPVTGSSSGHIALDSIGRIKFITGDRTDNSPASGQLQMKTFGQVQQHMESSYIEYNAGQDDKEMALNVMAYGKICEECVGHQRTIKGEKIVICANDLLVLKGQNVRIQATGEIQLAGGQMTKVTVNDKSIILGQKMTFGAGEETSMQFDPRAQVNVITPGSINHKVLQDYKLTALGCVSLFGVGGAGALVKNRAVGMGVSTKTKFAAGGTVAADLVSTGIVKVDGIAGVDIGSNASVDITSTGKTSIVSGAETEIDATGKVDISGTVTTITGSTKVQISGALIYLN